MELTARSAASSANRIKIAGPAADVSSMAMPDLDPPIPAELLPSATASRRGPASFRGRSSGRPRHLASTRDRPGIFSMVQHGRPALAGLLVLAGCLPIGAGCSATDGSRFRSAAGSRSIASVGGQTMPPTVGSSGARVVADTPEPEPYRNPKAQISGRVVDPQGRAVAGAIVRLADGASQAGRDVQASTDPSGAFTLRGLRPGSSYLLVAEAYFGGTVGTMIGRAEADTADTRVQIRLADSADHSTAAVPAGSRHGGRRSRPISDRTEADPGRDLPGVNDEDLGSPAGAAGEVGETAAARRPRAARSGATSGWHRPGADPQVETTGGSRTEPATDPAEAEQTADGPVDGILAESPRGPRLAPRHSRGADEEEANPLPPSLPAGTRVSDDESGATAEPDRARPEAGDREEGTPGTNGATSTTVPGALALSDPPPAAEASAAGAGLMPMPSLTGAGGPGPEIAAAEPKEPGLGGVPSLPESPPPDAVNLGGLPDAAQPPVAAAPGAVVSAQPAAPASESTVPSATPPAPASSPTDPSANYNPFALAAALPPEPVRATPTPSGAAATQVARAGLAVPEWPARPAPAAEVPVAGAEGGEAPPARRWGDVADGKSSRSGASPAGEQARRATATRAAQPASRPGTLLARRSRQASPGAAEAPSECRIDPRTNLLVDFQLPGLDGQAVRFRDLDADLVLLDFWGTWCDPCMKSIPHLVDLQKRYGPEKLRVVGVACEQLPATKRRAAVAAVAERLGINYPVLLSSKDGDCPVQGDFRVQFYPTMILLNRNGKVLTKIQGATQDNLLRLDNAIEAALQPAQTARR